MISRKIINLAETTNAMMLPDPEFPRLRVMVVEGYAYVLSDNPKETRVVLSAIHLADRIDKLSTEEYASIKSLLRSMDCDSWHAQAFLYGESQEISSRRVMDSSVDRAREIIAAKKDNEQ